MSATLAVALVLLAVVLMSAVTRWSEVLVAVPAAATLIVIGAVSTADAEAEIMRLLPVVIFLATLLLLSGVCDAQGLFRVFGDWLAHTSPGDSRALMGRVFVLSAATTAVLSLDATVVLLTPVVLDATRVLRVRHRPHTYSTAHLANSASLLLPVSNLTNLLAFSTSGMSFARFTALMAAPWLAVITAEYLLFRLAFRRDLAARSGSRLAAPPDKPPVFVLTVLLATLVGFGVTSWCGISPAWAALAGAVILGVRSLGQGRITIGGLARSVNVTFLVFVLALAVVVKAVVVNGVGAAISRVIPSETSLLGMLAIAVIAALLSNAVNNLPATLILLAPVSLCGPAGILAALVGLNVGPNLTYVGSLSNLLWRRVLHQRGETTSAAEFTTVGLLTVPVCLLVAVVILWAEFRVLGGSV